MILRAHEISLISKTIPAISGLVLNTRSSISLHAILPIGTTLVCKKSTLTTESGLN